MKEEWLVSGCDERISLLPQTQSNKYHLNPLKYEGLFMRGSCTCGTLTEFGHQTAQRFEKTYRIEEDAEWIKHQSKRIQDLFDGDMGDEFHVYFGPSGSDLMYWPLMMQSMLHPGETITNIVSCPEELGSGTALAAQGKFYASKNQFGHTVNAGSSVSQNLPLEVIFLPAREKSGHIAKRKQIIRDLIMERKGKPIICNLVFGSKSGIKDDFEIIDDFKDEVMWVVDLCQMRVQRELIHQLLSKGVMLMVTGSKFYQAPPFCGALLVPKFFTDALKEKSADHLEDFGKLFAAQDAPPQLDQLRKIWLRIPNVGLRLRWEIALDEMEAYLSIPKWKTEAIIKDWNKAVAERLSKSNYFELMPDMELTNNSIISFSVKVEGEELKNEALKLLFDTLVLSQHQGMNGYNRVFLGQPVRYDQRSFIRLAIGSYSIREMLVNGNFNPQNDHRLIELIEQTAKQLFEK